MIIGKICDFGMYKDPALKLEYLKKFICENDLSLFGLGTHELEPGILFVRENYLPNHEPNDKLISHDNCVEIYVLLSGETEIWYADCNANCVEISEPYDVDTDITEFEGKAECIYKMTLDSFVIMYPGDVHKIHMDAKKTCQIAKFIVYLEK